MQESNPGGKKARPKRILMWAVILVIALPVLFYLFEYVVPRLMPANF